MLKLKEAIGDYEMSDVQCSLCAVGGILYVRNDKFSLMHAFEQSSTKFIQVIMAGYVEGQVNFDRYLDLFPKNKTSQERAVYLQRI